MDVEDLEYVGFWPRVVAGLLDAIIVIVVTYPLLIAIYGLDSFGGDAPLVRGPADVLISWILPSLATILFWIGRQATPGKMAIGARIVDAASGRPISTEQAILRYLAYFVALLPLGLGFVWIAFDSRRQGWHDKLARTVVVRARNHRAPKPVNFAGG